MAQIFAEHIASYFRNFGFLQKKSTFLKAVFVLFLLAGFSGFGQTVSITASQPNANEAGPINGEFTVSVTGGGALFSIEVFLDVSGTSTAISGVDYTPLQSSVVVPLIAGSGSSTLDLEPLQDLLIEDSESVVLNISTGPYLIDPTNSLAEVIIASDDIGNVTIVATDSDASEAGLNTGEYTIELGGANETSGPITVNYVYGGITDADFGDDFVALPLSLDIPIGDQNGTIILTPIDDDLVEGNETVRLNLVNTSSPVLFPIDPDTADNRDDVFISSDDIADINVSLISNDTSEDGDVATFDVVLTAQPLTNVVLDVVSGNTAEGTVDLAVLTFTNANWDERQTVTVTGVDDLVVDGDQIYDITVSINIGSSDAAFATVGDKLVSVTNLDNDEFEVRITASDDTATESPLTTGEYTVSLDQPNNTGGPVIVGFTITGTATSGDDFTPIGSTVSIIDGADEAIITLTPIDDSEIEADEDVIVTLGAAVGYTVDPTNSSATVTIESDDLPIIRIDNETALEGNSGSGPFNFTVRTTDNTNVQNDINFTYQTLAGTGANPATAGVDYVAVTAGIGTILAGESSVTVPVQVNGDTTPEADENFRVRIETLNATISRATAVGTIQNDDVPSISINDVALAEEDAGTTDFVFTVSIDDGVPALADIEFDYSTANGTATIGDDDYEQEISEKGEIEAGETSTTITVRVNGDEKVEGNETFVVNVINAVNATINDGQGQGIISNDDSAVVTIADVDGLEDDGAITVSVVLDNAVQGGFSLEVSTTDGTATALEDYNPIPGQLLTFAGTANELETFTVFPISDAVIEEDETLSITMDDLASTVVAIDISDTATVTILNDDSCAAGTVAPVLNPGTPTAFCDFESQDLDDYTNSIAPVGSALRWSVSDADLDNAATHLSSNVVTTVGTYYGFFFDEINNCASPALEITLISNDTPSAGTANNVSACSSGVNGGETEVDLDSRLTGQDSGIWSVVTDPSNGGVTISAGNVVDFEALPLGNYVFRYTTDGAVAPCIDQSTDLTVTVIDCTVNCDAGVNAPLLDTAQPTNFCDVLSADLNNYVTNAAPAGSVLTWSFDSDPFNLGAHRSNIVSAPGTYYGFFFDDADADNTEDCASPVLAITLQLNPSPAIESTSDGLRCGDGTVTLNATGTIGATLNWYATETSMVVLGTGTSFITPTISETTSFFVEATANGCPSPRVEVIATVNIEPSPGVPSNTTGCSEVGPAGTTILDLDTTLTGADPGVWAVTIDPSNGGVTINTDNTVNFQSLPLGNYVFTYTTTGAEAPCTNQSVEVTINVIDCLLDADFDGLNDDVEVEIGTDPNNPDTDGDGIEDGQEVNVDATDPLDDCDSIGGTPLGDSDCDSDGLTNSEENDLGTDPFDADSDDDGLTDGEEVLVEDDPITEAIPENPSDPLDNCDPFLTGDCNADPIDILIEKSVDIASPLIGDIINFTITITNLSMERGVDIVVTDLIDGDSGFELVSSTADSGSYDPITGLWTIAELLGEASSNLFITVRVVRLGRLANTSSLISSIPVDGDASNNSATVEITVSQSECVDIGTICNLFSPNGDGVNDTLVLVGHENFPSSQLQIFDRYGNLIYFEEGYDSTWDGTGENGNLPRGTYYYILNLGNGSEVIKGWIQIIR